MGCISRSKLNPQLVASSAWCVQGLRQRVRLALTDVDPYSAHLLGKALPAMPCREL